jgi:hypothetical protein
MHVATTPISQSSLTFRSLCLSLYFLHVATTPNSQCTSISRHFSIPWILQQNSFLQCVYPLDTSTKSIPSLHPFYNPFFLLAGEGTYFQQPIFLSLYLSLSVLNLDDPTSQHTYQTHKQIVLSIHLAKCGHKLASTVTNNVAGGSSPNWLSYLQNSAKFLTNAKTRLLYITYTQQPANNSQQQSQYF